MRRTGRVPLAAALALGVALAMAATAGTIARQDRQSWPVTELLRVEPLADFALPGLESQLRFFEGILARDRFWTEADLRDRFTEGWAEDFTADELNQLGDSVFATHGRIRYLRLGGYQPLGTDELGVGPHLEAAQVLGVTDTGAPIDILVAARPDGRMESASFGPFPGDMPRLPVWESAGLVVTGCVLLVAAAAAARYGGRAEPWWLLGAALTVLAGSLVSTDSGLAYTVGRVGPALLVVPALALVAATGSPRVRRWLLAGAGAAALLGLLAPFTRDATVIGHPALTASLTDTEAAYRALLAGAAGLAALVLGTAAVTTGRQVTRAPLPTRPALWLTALALSAWALAASGTAVDDAIGDGGVADGLARGVTLAAVGLLALAVVFRLAVAHWGRPELASLVIDLEHAGADLRPALARALDDPLLEVLSSPDGTVLIDADGRPVGDDDLPDERALTKIRAGSRLIGGLVHDERLRLDPDRLEAVAAAAGMAIELNELNQQVAAQLEEVEASRARILDASDTARRQLERDLHDGAQQRLVALGIILQRARRQARPPHQSPLAELFEQATSELRGAIDDVRTVSRGAQPALLAERGLRPAVDALAERAPVPVRVDIGDGELSSRAERAAFYVIAEALTNVAKHARATEAAVAVSRSATDAVVLIRDDGQGGAEISPGSGLQGLSDRIAATGGSLDIDSGPGGTTLTALIPCE